MKNTIKFSWLIQSFVLGLWLVNFAYSSNTIERYLLVAGANYGGSDRVTLRYANHDAFAFANVFTEMGGVPKDHVIQLKNPSKAELQAGITKLESQLKKVAPNIRKEVIVYYSGHADESGLLLGENSYGWKEFRKVVDALPAEVKITVLDACGSGAITRLKGGQRQPAFLMDVSTDMKGYAFLTSSSDNEVAQESDRIGGSYFTQSLVTGLRGAADLNHDKKVTLSEAYQYAFNETMQRTQSTSGGTQHPSRDMKLSGTGDVVMTDLREVSAGLVLANDLEGRVYVRDQKQTLIAELQKSINRPLEIGLAPGTYSIQLQNKKTFLAEKINLTENGKKEISRKDFKEIVGEKTTARGGLLEGNTQDTIKNPVMDSLRRAYVEHGAGWDIGFLTATKSVPWNGYQASLLVSGNSEEVVGHQFSLITNYAEKEIDGVQITSLVNWAYKINGVQISSAINAANFIKGFQLSGGLNYAENMQGLQLAPINYADTLNGHQIGQVNIADSINGYQISVLNIAASVKHQIGVMNIAGQTQGIQLGVLNIAGQTNSYTFGLVNIIGTANKPVFGILNIIGNGLYNVSTTYNELGLGLTHFQLGSSVFHFNIIAGSDLQKEVKTYGGGFGTQFGMDKKTWIGLNANSMVLFKDWEAYRDNIREVTRLYGNWSENYLSQIKLEYGYRPFKYAAIFGGVSANVLVANSWERVLVTPQGDYQGAVYRDQVYVWPGLFMGIKLGSL